ncbi:uncharacterized protein [Amphiura filiformis]|uniref:uncharacterized protein n=1 Tax=Amphiura filiformis TaxID=82378 RepID=UPI003B21F65A
MASAHDEPTNGSYFILQFDKEVESKGSRTSLLHSQPKHQKLLRGSLLEPVHATSQWQEPRRALRGNGKVIKLRRLQIGNDTASYEIDCYASEVQRITKDEMELLSAITSDNERFRVYFEPDQLKNALALQENMLVKVDVKCDTMKQTLPGIVRYIGPLPNERGRQFGIELHENPGQGSSDGMFGKKRFFTCNKDSAVFVGVNKLKFDKDALYATIPPRVKESQSGSVKAAPRQSFVESDLKKNMEVYVSTKKGSKEEYVKGKIIYIGKPRGEHLTYVGVELEKPRTSPWDGTFKSHRLCQPKTPWYSELVPINDIVPAGFLEEQECSSPTPSCSGPPKSKPPPGRAVHIQTKPTQSVTVNSKGNKKAGGAKKNSSECQSRGTPSLLHSFTGMHAHPTEIATIQCQNTYLPLQTLSSGSNDGTNSKGQDINLKVQEQLFDSAKKASKDNGNASNPKGFRKFSKDFMNRLQSLGSNKEVTSIQAGISFSAVVSGKVALVELDSSPLSEVDVTELPPLGTDLIEEICLKVDHNWAFLAHNLEVDKTRIEKISGKTSNSADRVILTLVHWWKKVHKQPQAIQTLAYALSELKLEKLAGRVLIAISESEMDTELLDIVADRTYSKWKSLASELGLENETIEEIDKSGSPLYKDAARRMLDVWDQEISIGCEKLSLLVRACRHSGNAELANELEQGLDTDMMERISRMVDATKWFPFGEALGFSNEHLIALENSCDVVKLRVYTMLGSWRNTQPFTSDKILAISTALEHCGLSQLAWEICRGLDEDLLNDLAFKLQKDWRRIGTLLHLPNAELSKLANGYTDDAKRAHQVLVKWRKRQHASCDLLGELAKVLRETEHRKIADWLVQGIHDNVLDKIASLIADEWEELAKNLGFQKADIEAIKDGNKLEAQRIYKMLCQWRYRQHYRIWTESNILPVKWCHKVLGSNPNDAITTDQLMTIAKELSSRWQIFAGDLNIDRNDIFKISETSFKPEDKCHQLLLLWQESRPAGDDGKKDLIQALESCGRHDLVVSILGPRAGMDNDFSKPTSSYSVSSESPVKEEDLLEIAGKIEHRWKRMANDLGFKQNEIIDIEGKAPSSADQCYCMLQTWKETKLLPGYSGQKDLERAMERCGHRDLIAKLWNNRRETTDSPMMASDTQATNISEITTVTYQMMLDVAKHVEFNPLVNALNLETKDIDMIKVNYQKPERRCYYALDTWVRRGEGNKRKVSELLQVLQAMGRTDLVKMITSLSVEDMSFGVYGAGGGGVLVENFGSDLLDAFFGMNWLRKNKTPKIKAKGNDEVDCAHSSRIDKDTSRIVPIEVKHDYYGSNSKALDNKDAAAQDSRPSPVTQEKVKEHASMLFESVPLPDNTYSLEVNSMVEITKSDEKLYGVMRWMGYNQRVGSMAGIELEEKLTSGGTDGTLFGNRCFHCEHGRAIFVKLSSVKPDSRFPSQTETFTKRKRLTSQDFGGFKSPTLKGYIHPPKKLTLEFVGRKKGIQGDQNSCYLDTTLYSMYAYSNIFDDILHRKGTHKDLTEYESVQTILRENIVNPLRSYGFVRADRVLKLREYLDQLGTTKGLTSEEKDPEEFLHTFLQEVTKTEPFLHIRQQGSTHVEKSYHYQIFMEKNESYQLPTVEQLLHYSFLHSDLRLTKVPPCLIMQMPRFGKEYRMYNRILPSLYLDISDLLEGWPRICTVCGKLAEYECRDCSGQLEEAGIVEAINSYCQDCCNTVHAHRKNHNVKAYQLGDEFLAKYAQEKENGTMEQEIHEKVFAPRKMMELFAVVCIETSHYVAFVKAGSGSGQQAQWVFFDSMADREGDQQGYNIPEITHLPQFQQWIENETVLKETKDKDLPPPLRRLLCDGYMCMYQDPDVANKHTREFQQTTPIDKIAEQAPLPGLRERASSNEMQVDDNIYVVTNVSGSRGSTSSYGVSPPQHPHAPPPQHPPAPAHYLETTTPAISYTTHRGPSQGSSSKAAANAALCYRNYADALTSPPQGSAPKGATSNPAADYRKYAEVAGSSGPMTNGNKQPQFSAYRLTPQDQTMLKSRGSSSFDDELIGNSSKQHVGHVGYDDDGQHRGDTSSIHSRDSQYASLPTTPYTLQLSEDADMYSRPKEQSVIINQEDHIHHPPSRTDFPVVRNVVADAPISAPIPRGHPSRQPQTNQRDNYQYNRDRYQTNLSASASRLAKHDIRSPPTDDDEMRNVIAGFSLGGTTL